LPGKKDRIYLAERTWIQVYDPDPCELLSTIVPDPQLSDQACRERVAVKPINVAVGSCPYPTPVAYTGHNGGAARPPLDAIGVVALSGTSIPEVPTRRCRRRSEQMLGCYPQVTGRVLGKARKKT
jgi:hypothetical protein